MRIDDVLRKPTLRYLISISAVLGMAVGLTALLMQPPLSDLLELGAIYGLTALVSAAVGFLAHRYGLWRLGSLAGSLTLGYALAAGLTLLNVWVAARLMFISQHDLALATVLLLFASGISVSFGYLLSRSFTASLEAMVAAADEISDGDFTARVPVTGRDEVAQLAQAFNRMASRLQLAAEEARRLENARRDFVSWVSHDLRTPLASLRAMVDAMADGVVADPENVQRYLSLSQGEISRLNGLIDDLFELSQLDTGHMQLNYEVCSLHDLVSDTVGGLRPRAEEEQIDVTAAVDPAVDPVRIAPRQVSRVLQNLLDNSLRHTPAGGEIHLAVECEGQDVTVRVQDTGDGIPPGDLALIFERFYRGEQSRRRNADKSGAGLGLAIARGIVEAHGGQIWAEQDDTGATFCFTLPQVRVRLADGDPS